MYYYRTKNGNNYLKVKTPLDEEVYDVITYDEWNAHIKSLYTHTPAQINIINLKQRITELKQLLASTDYQAIKFAEGQLTTEEYEPMRTQRQLWRDEINQIEAQLNNPTNEDLE